MVNSRRIIEKAKEWARSQGVGEPKFVYDKWGGYWQSSTKCGKPYNFRVVDEL